jgi:uncharacterized membrane protein
MQQACRQAGSFILMLAIVWAVSIAALPQRASAAGEVELYTAYTDLSAPPGESITYSIEIINRSETTQLADIGFQTNGNDWEYELSAGGRAIRQIAIKPDESQTVNLQLNVPLDVNKGEYNFTVTAGGMDTLPLKVGVSEQGTFTTEFTAEQANMEGHADSSFTFSTTLRNRTAEVQTYALSAAVEPGWDVRFSAGGNSVTSVAVEPNASQTISVQVMPPDNVSAGTYAIPIMAANNATQAETKLEVVVTGSYGIALSTPDERLNAEVKAGSDRTMELVVKNTGTAELEDINLSAQTPANWEVSFEPKTIRTLAPGATANVQAVIQADDKALAGDYVVNMTARTSQKSADAAIRVAVQSSVLWGWIGILIILAVAAGVYYLFRKYGRR